MTKNNIAAKDGNDIALLSMIEMLGYQGHMSLHVFGESFRRSAHRCRQQGLDDTADQLIRMANAVDAMANAPRGIRGSWLSKFLEAN